jgi:hypothetical protein
VTSCFFPSVHKTPSTLGSSVEKERERENNNLFSWKVWILDTKHHINFASHWVFSVEVNSLAKILPVLVHPYHTPFNERESGQCLLQTRSQRQTVSLSELIFDSNNFLQLLHPPMVVDP